MARGTGSPIDPDKLIADYKLYDRSVDVVSAYHWLFTETEGLPSTVAHFERYPKIEHSDGNVATPDFTVLFDDGTGIAAEIANLARHDTVRVKKCRLRGLNHKHWFPVRSRRGDRLRRGRRPR